MRCSIFVAMVLALGLVSCSGGSGSSSSENSSVTTVSSSSESVTPSSSSLLSSSSSLASSSVTASSSSEVVISSSSSAQSSLAASSSIPSGAVLDDGLMGWATQHPAGAPTGGEGADGQSCTVTNITELVQCFSDLRKTTVPYTVYVKGTINGANEDGTGYTIAEIKGRKTTGMENTGNVSLIGIVENGQLPTLNAVWLKVSYVDNIIIRNLRVVAGLDTSLGSMEACSGDTDYCDWNVEADAVTMQTVIRAWIDHCEFTDGFDFNGVNPVKANYKYHDGLVDIKKASDYITISYSKFSNHDKTMLIGSSDSDAGDYRITFFRNQFQYIGQRAPRVRFGKVHLLNNYYDNQLHTAEQHKYYMSYAVGLGYSSQVYSEGNVFDIPSATAGDLFGVGFDKWAQHFTDVGSWLNDANEDLNAAAASKINAQEASEGEGLGYLGNVIWKPSDFYSYPTLSTAAEVRDIVSGNLGVGKIQP